MQRALADAAGVIIERGDEARTPGHDRPRRDLSGRTERGHVHSGRPRRGQPPALHRCRAIDVHSHSVAPTECTFRRLEDQCVGRRPVIPTLDRGIESYRDGTRAIRVRLRRDDWPREPKPQRAARRGAAIQGDGQRTAAPRAVADRPERRRRRGPNSGEGKERQPPSTATRSDPGSELFHRAAPPCAVLSRRAGRGRAAATAMHLAAVGPGHRSQ